MSVDFKKFERWAISRFGEDNVLVKGKEVKINSIFENEDTGYHLWCNPGGGKKKYKYGVFHCFKTDKKGSLVKLVQIVDNCDKEDAVDILNGRTPIRELEKKLEELFKSVDQEGKEEGTEVRLNLPNECHLITELGTNNWWRQRAESYLENRKIPIEGLYICTGDRYKNRIIIPYYDKKGTLIYWNARALGESKCKYLGPPKEVGVGKEDVVYMAGKWPEQGSTVYVCEGEFNAKSLLLAELNGAACGGKNMSKKQAILLSDYKIVLCLDRDKAGKAGTMKMTSIISSMETAKSGSGDKLMFVTPPKDYNDWNEFLVKNSTELLHHYIIKNQKKIDYSGPNGTTCDVFGFSDIWR
jgi:hypothetical protein